MQEQLEFATLIAPEGSLTAANYCTFSSYIHVATTSWLSYQLVWVCTLLTLVFWADCGDWAIYNSFRTLQMTTLVQVWTGKECL